MDSGVDIFAPYFIYSTNRYGTYDPIYGTSFSSPIVAGICALIKAKYQDMHAYEIKDLILKTATILDWTSSGYGEVRFVNAAAALNGDGLFSGGTGTSFDPYLIKNRHDLMNTYFVSGKHFILENNIVLPYQAVDSMTFIPIPHFNGYPDGNNKTVFNVNCIYTSGQRAGLYTVNMGEIKNLNVSGSLTIINGAPIVLGMVAAENYGNIYNCKTYGAVTNHSGYNLSYVGGITGYNRTTGRIEDCENRAYVYSLGGYSGGIYGINYGYEANNINYGTIGP